MTKKITANIIANSLDQAPKCGEFYRKILDNTEFKNEILEAFEKNSGNTLDEKIQVLKQQIQLLENEKCFYKEYYKKDRDGNMKLKKHRYNKVWHIKENSGNAKELMKLSEEIEYNQRNRIEKINDSFEKWLFTEKMPVGETIKKFLFGDHKDNDRSSMYILAKELVEIKDEKTRFYLFKKLHSMYNNLFFPHSNYDRSYFDKEEIKKMGDQIGFSKYGIEPATSSTSTGCYYGYCDYYTKDELKNNGLKMNSGYKVKNVSVKYDLGDFNGFDMNEYYFDYPIFCSDGEYPKYQEEFFKLYPDHKKKIDQIQKDITDTAQESIEKYKVYNKKLKKTINENKQIDQFIEQKKETLISYQEERDYLSKLSDTDKKLYLKYQEKTGSAQILQRLINNVEDFDLENFLNNTSWDFIKKCDQMYMRPCMDGENEVAIKIEEAPSVNTGAGLQYGKNLSVWYDGQIQDTKYFKYRDGYSSSGDIPSNFFRSIKDIKVNKDSGEVTVLTSSGGDGSKYITFNIEMNTKNENIDEAYKEKFKKDFSMKKNQLLNSHTRTGKVKLWHNMKYRGNLTNSMDPHKMVDMEKANLLSEAINYSKGLGAIVLSAQIDARVDSGRQMEYVAYIIKSNTDAEQVRRETIYAESIHNGKDVKIPDANDVIKKYI